ncbi:hypothetical protein A2U01_0063744, partial [Trifolium medium]|nr:hypothetical protein [Trifolium medium]
MEVAGVDWEVSLSFVYLCAAVFTELMSDKIQGFCVRSCYNAFVSNKHLEETDDLLLEALRYLQQTTNIRLKFEST